MSDVLYEEEWFDALILTLSAVSHGGTELFMSHNQRRPVEASFYEKVRAAGFTVERVPFTSKITRVSEHVDLWVLKRHD
jgi:hypothetical protein